MTIVHSAAATPPGQGVGPLLRAWREQRRLSQLELALRADSSARHVSFVETGRSRPSEEMVLRLAEHLEVPVRERNALLLAAGYAPRFPETPLDDPALGAVREGIERLIQGYEPYPALVFDAAYHVVAANRGIMMLLDGIPAPRAALNRRIPPRTSRCRCASSTRGGRCRSSRPRPRSTHPWT
jgi:transcriptional regulator with XRE-family HTH domain